MTYTKKLHLTTKDIHLDDIDDFLGKDVEIIMNTATHDGAGRIVNDKWLII